MIFVPAHEARLAVFPPGLPYVRWHSTLSLSLLPSHALCIKPFLRRCLSWLFLVQHHLMPPPDWTRLRQLYHHLISKVPPTRPRHHSDPTNSNSFLSAKSTAMASSDKSKVFLGAIDQGTTSSRFLIFDVDGNPVATHQIEFQQIYPQSGYVTGPSMSISANPC